MKSSTNKTGSKYLLDTNIIIEIFGGNMSIADKVNSLNEFAICTIVLGKLYVGINRVKNKTKHLNIIAAVAIQHGYTLVTADKHYNVIDEILIYKW